MKKHITVIFFCLYTILGYSQEVLRSFPVVSECISGSSYVGKIQYGLRWIYYKDEEINLLELTRFSSWYESNTVIKLTPTQDNTFEISSFDFTLGDYSGTGAYSDDEITIDYSFIDAGYKEECHLTTVPLLCPSFSLVSPKVWSFISYSNNGNTIGTNLYRYKIEYDVEPLLPPFVSTCTLNDKQYLILESSNNNGTDWNDLGYIRAENEKVYFVAKGDTEETLLYDFTLNVGDTFNGMELLSVDTIDI